MPENQSFSIQGFNLVTLLKRLEAATSRLEDVTIYQENRNGGGESATAPTTTTAPAAAVVESKEPAAAIEAVPVPVPVAAPAPAVVEDAKSIQEFDLLISEKIKPYVELSKKIDPILGEQAGVFAKAVDKEREVLKGASLSKKLAVEEGKFQELVILPINELIMKVIEIKDSNRSNKKFNYLNAVAEGVAVLGWIVVNTPVSYIPDFKDSAQFWTNRILKDVKGSEDEKDSVEWVKSFLSIFDELKRYVKEYHTTGITWGGNEDFEKVMKDSEASAGGGACAAPPPPPPPPPPANLFEEVNKEGSNEKKKEDGSGGGMNAVFAELNKGEGITSGLRKVEKSQMTHKNPELRKKTGPLPPKKPKSLSSSSKEEEKDDVKEVKKAKKRAPQNELVDNKWMITNVGKEDVCGMITIEGSMDQSVYIGNCEGIVVNIKGKVNAISVNVCKSVGIVVERAISSVELTKCSKCEVQIVESVPVISVDQSESVSVYLSDASLDVALYSSACTALNVNVPDGDASGDAAGDLREVAVPEQLVTRFVRAAGGGAVRAATEAVSHA